MRAPRLVAAIASLGVVFAAPFVGQIRGALQVALPGQYRNIIVGMVGGVVVVAVSVAVARVRDRRVLRYGLLGAAVASGAGFAYLTGTGNPDVDAVERFHFVEYGVLMLLVHRVWRDRRDAISLVFPALVGIVVGTLDEAFQWFVPARVGELHDVLLNGAAVACGVVFAVGIDPPGNVMTSAVKARRRLACGVAAAVVVLAAFVVTVHLGYEIRDASGSRFRSRFSAAGLEQAARDRAGQWRIEPPTALRRVSREDQYLAEGIWHVERRNEALSDDDAGTAWSENLILESAYAPVLDFPTYLTPSGARWLPEQKTAVSALVERGSDRGPFVSTANPVPIYTWNRAGFVAVVAALVLLVAAVGFAPMAGPSAS